MKNIMLIRHAKSSWDNPQWSDFERPLNQRGISDAKAMAELLKGKQIIFPEIIFSSTAERAINTAHIFADVIGFDKESIIEDFNIYEKGTRYILDLFSSIDNSINSVALFGHNPDMTSLSSFLSGRYFENIPTCGIVSIDFELDDWKEIGNVNGELKYFEYIKKYR